MVLYTATKYINEDRNLTMYKKHLPASILARLSYTDS